ncbi:MAG: single-stranded-DNA-specific exonuclease RecJ, partial [Phycisphaerales bacterium JB059]
LHDPATMPGLDRACERLLEALRNAERVVIYGDYDVDGVSSTAILYHTMRAIAPEAPVGWYIPHRLDEGYGLNSEALAQIASDGARVVVSVDCGVTAIEPALAARNAGLDLIITDHHNPPAPGDPLPDAFALIHPRAPGSEYPFAELCGAGVAYKLAWRLATMHCGSDKVSPELRQTLIDMLAPCALGVIADVVPLVDENRVFARYGLSMVKRSSLVGLRALVRASGLDGENIDSEMVGFRIAPRLNACGRLGHARQAVELLTTSDKARAAQIADAFTQLNDDRRRVERRILEQACEMAEARGMTGPDARAIVLAHEDWHPGVVGIVCSRLVERYARPAILLQHQGDILTGSGRSIDGFNLHGALQSCAEHLLGFGGHDMAAGLRLDPQNLDAFTEAMLAHTAERLAPDDLILGLRYDCEAQLAELTPRLVRDLDSLAPFGRANPRVRLRLNDLRVAGQPRVFGKLGAHLNIILESRQTGPRAINTVAWGWAERAHLLPRGARVDAIVAPRISDYSKRVEPELLDLRLRDPNDNAAPGCSEGGDVSISGSRQPISR